MEAFELANLSQILGEVLLGLLPVIEAILLTSVLFVELLLDAEKELAEFGHLLERLHLIDVLEAANGTFQEEGCAHRRGLLPLLKADLDEVLSTEATRAQLVNFLVDFNEEPVKWRHQRGQVLLGLTC